MSKTAVALRAAQEQSEGQTSVLMGRRVGAKVEQRKRGETGGVLWDEREPVGTLGLAWRHRGEVESITSLEKRTCFDGKESMMMSSALYLLLHTQASGLVAEECDNLPPNGFVASANPLVTEFLAFLFHIDQA